MTEYIDKILRTLKLKQLDEDPNLFFIEKQLGVKPSALIIAITIFSVIVTFTSNASNIVVGLICCLVPAYFTFVSLEREDKQDYKKYLTYWILYAIIELVAPFIGFVIGSFLYILIRVALTIALLHPSFNLTIILYDKHLGPILRDYQGKIDNTIDQHVQRGQVIVRQGRQRVVSQGRQFIQPY